MARLIKRLATRGVLPGALAAGIAAAMIASQGSTAAAVGSSTTTTPLVSVAQGSGTAPLSSGTPLGNTDPSTPVDISIVLRAQNLNQLENQVQSGWNGQYLTTRQFAQQYGQSPLVILGIEKYLNAFGITTSAYSDGLDISANGTAGQFNKALSITLQNFQVKTPTSNGHSSWQTIHGSLRNPSVPQQYGSPILAILGLSNYSPYVSEAKVAVGNQVATAAPEVQPGGQALPAGELSPEDFVNRYKLAPLEASGARGQGETIGIVTLAALDPTVPLAFWNNYLGLHESPSRLTLVPIDGGAPGPSAEAGSDETDLDVEQSGAIAPAANIRVYEAPNTDPGFADAFFAAASDNIADTVSVSWGESETYIQVAVASGTETPSYAQVFDEAFLELAAQGQSDFTATGDEGAYDAIPDAGTTNLAADNPSDSPYTTAAGGTTLPSVQTFALTDADGNPTGVTDSANIPQERSWSWDYLAPMYAAFGAPSEAALLEGDPYDFVAGDNGGYSVLEPRPSYQQGVVSSYQYRQYLTPTTFVQEAPGVVLPTEVTFNATPSLRSGYQGSGRATPDVSTDADPETGFAVYDPNLFDGGFAQYGGTSFVAPQLNGATAVIDSYVGHRVGFWNPRIYQFASSVNSPFTPLNDTTAFQGKQYLYQTNAKGHVTALAGEFSNNNEYFTGNPGSIWNPAAGLGIPDLTALAKKFAH
jgi:kumamolisin